MDCFIGEIRIFPWGKIPSGWAACNGQLLQIKQNAALFGLLGTIYGGDGQTTFGLPDLRGAAMIGAGINAGTTYATGNSGGSDTVTLTTSNMPAHIHLMNAVSANGTQILNLGDDNLAIMTVATGTPAVQTPINTYIQDLANPVTLSANTVENFGGSQPHENRMPLQALNVCICIVGVYPPRD